MRISTSALQTCSHLRRRPGQAPQGCRPCWPAAAWLLPAPPLSGLARQALHPSRPYSLSVRWCSADAAAPGTARQALCLLAACCRCTACSAASESAAPACSKVRVVSSSCWSCAASADAAQRRRSGDWPYVMGARAPHAAGLHCMCSGPPCQGRKHVQRITQQCWSGSRQGSCRHLQQDEVGAVCSCAGSFLSAARNLAHDRPRALHHRAAPPARAALHAQ